jgi:purine-cytosine permease-like protein
LAVVLAALVTVCVRASAFVGIRFAGRVPPFLALPGGLLCLVGVALARSRFGHVSVPGALRRGP